MLLIDEIDRADEEFEAYPAGDPVGVSRSPSQSLARSGQSRPHVILTANGTRDLSDALRRRCLYSYVDYPDRETELAILRARCARDLEPRLAQQIVGVVQALRREELEKKPGIAEMLDWAAALMGLGIADLTRPRSLQATLAPAEDPADRRTHPRPSIGPTHRRKVA